MASQNASIAAARAAIPQSLVRGNQQDGELRVFFSTVTNPASGGVAVGEYISWGHLPLGARVVGGFLTCSAGASSSTLNLGDAVTPARYLAASAVNAAANVAINPPATFASGAAGFEVSVVAPGLATDHSEIRSVCAGANLGANQTLTLYLLYVCNN
ncbi:MAG: hypothetical protein IT518_20240 [Burkholderiales bacterium]|nr:hypothetical protein [Burkholderiales bacterium]